MVPRVTKHSKSLKRHLITTEKCRRKPIPPTRDSLQAQQSMILALRCSELFQTYILISLCCRTSRVCASVLIYQMFEPKCRPLIGQPTQPRTLQMTGPKRNHTRLGYHKMEEY